MAAVYSICKHLARLAAFGLAQLSFAGPAATADTRVPATTEAIVQFHTVCSNCHEAQCSGRLSFDSGSAGARSHIERYIGTTNDDHLAALFAMLRHVKETCGHYPALPVR
ncbi:hypothetical protein EPN95_04835, partial [Patescibacteria group bacterium]